MTWSNRSPVSYPTRDPSHGHTRPFLLSQKHTLSASGLGDVAHGVVQEDVPEPVQALSDDTLAGIVAGVMLGIARVMGETAPVLLQIQFSGSGDRS